MSFGQRERSDCAPALFRDGQSTGVIYHRTYRHHIRAAIVNAGIARHATQDDAPGTDIAGRLKLCDWSAVAPMSPDHLEAALRLGDRIIEAVA